MKADFPGKPKPLLQACLQNHCPHCSALRCPPLIVIAMHMSSATARSAEAATSPH